MGRRRQANDGYLYRMLLQAYIVCVSSMSICQRLLDALGFLWLQYRVHSGAGITAVHKIDSQMRLIVLYDRRHGNLSCACFSLPRCLGALLASSSARVPRPKCRKMGRAGGCRTGWQTMDAPVASCSLLSCTSTNERKAIPYRHIYTYTLTESC